MVALSQTTTFNMTPIPLTTDFLNWDRGATLWNEQDAPNGTMNIPVDGAPQKMKDAYHRFGMTQFFNNASASDSTIIFDDLDEFFNYCIDNKMGARFRVMGVCNNCGNPAIGDNFNNQVQYGAGRPSNEWQVVPWFLHNLQQADADPAKRDFFSTRGDQKAWIPNVNSWPFQRWVGKLSTAIKNHINSTSHNGVLYADVLRIYDLGYYGCYSEQHSACLCDQITDGNIPVGARHYPSPNDAGIMAIVNQQTNAFGGNTKWKIVIPFNAYDAVWLAHTFNTVDYGNFLLNHPDSIGWIDDHLGSDESYDHDYLEFNDRINNSKLMSRWKYSPHGGEPVEWGAPADRSAIPNYVTKYHLTFFGNGNLNGFYTNDNTTQANNFRLASRLAGYRLKLTGGSAVTTSTQLTINLNWLNEGNAPTYWSWNVRYLIKNGSTVLSTLNSNFNPRYFQPSPSGSSTTISQTFGMPAIPSGDYGLYVIVQDPSGYRDAMFLANTPRQGDGSYFLGNISVTTGTSNVPPVANAGPNQSIATTSVSLNGLGSTDADGTISTYSWARVSGPNVPTIVSASSANTNVTGLIAGTYVFRLTVTDDDGATNSDDVQITVTSSNQAPVANAGPNKTVTVAGTSLSGSGTDDVGISSYLWSQQSGPNAAVIGTPTSASTTIGNLVVGTYVFRLTVTDAGGLTGFDDMTLTVTSGNTAPIANAGANITVTLPVINFQDILLDGSLSSDPGGAVATYLWTQVGGPATVTIAAPTNVATYINNVTVAGIYTIRLTVTDNQGLTHTDDVQITVNPAPSPLPVANAGPNQVITSPTNFVALSGSASTGIILQYNWQQISGPAPSTIAFPNAVNTNVTNLVVGVYVFRLTVTNSSGSSTDDVTITVLAAANVPPIADAGGNTSVTLPTNSVAASGSGSSDPDGTIVSYQWTFVSGPAITTFTAANSVNTTVNNLVNPGTYVVMLTVTDNSGATDTDLKTIIVNAAVNASPVAIITITSGTQVMDLPINTITLSGITSTDDVAIVSYAWSQTSGPSAATIATPAGTATNISNMVAGVYFFQLTVTDGGGLTDTDIIQITVNNVAQHPMNGDRTLMPGLKFLPRHGHL